MRRKEGAEEKKRRKKRKKKNGQFVFFSLFFLGVDLVKSVMRSPSLMFVLCVFALFLVMVVIMHRALGTAGSGDALLRPSLPFLPLLSLNHPSQNTAAAAVAAPHSHTTQKMEHLSFSSRARG